MARGTAADARPTDHEAERLHDEFFDRMLAAASREAYALTASEMDRVAQVYHEHGGARRAYSMDRALEAVLSERAEAVDSRMTSKIAA